MKIFLAGGYLKDTADALRKLAANRLFSYYDILEKRVNMDRRFHEMREVKNENLSCDLVRR